MKNKNNNKNSRTNGSKVKKIESNRIMSCILTVFMSCQLFVESGFGANKDTITQQVINSNPKNFFK